MTDTDYGIDSQGWISSARQVRSPNTDKRPDGVRPDLLVIHNISLPPEQFGGPYIEQLFTNCLQPQEHPYFKTIADLKVSSHLLIDRKGNLIQFVSLHDRAWHAGVSSWQGKENCNDYSIGIELEGSDNQEFTPIQYEVLSAITKSLKQAYPEISHDRIVGHSDIAPGRKTDPGPHFNWQKFKQFLN